MIRASLTRRLASLAVDLSLGERRRFLRINVNMNLISIQSHVAYGHVGNSAAVFALQRLGCEVWPVHTVQFSNHLGYGAFRGSVFEAAVVDDIVQGIAERGALTRCDGVLSGYLGAADLGAVILDAVA